MSAPPYAGGQEMQGGRAACNRVGGSRLARCASNPGRSLREGEAGLRALDSDDFGLTRFVIATPDLIGIYTLQASRELFPGESRGPRGAALCHLDPGFRRGTVACRKGIIAKPVQGDEKRNIALRPIPGIPRNLRRGAKIAEMKRARLCDLCASARIRFKVGAHDRYRSFPAVAIRSPLPLALAPQMGHILT